MLGPRTASFVLCVLGLVGCGKDPKAPRVVRVHPPPGQDGVVRIALNQVVTVHFSEPIDPFTVTEDTFRISGPDGLSVPGIRETGTRTVTFRPVPPVTASLDDGSFRPGGRYRVEIPGFPRSNCLRSTNGRYVDERVVLELRVPDDPAELGLPTLFLPVGIGTEPLLLDAGPERLLRLAADSRRLRMHYSLPLWPLSVRPDALHFQRIVAGRAEPEVLVPAEVRVLPEQVPGTSHHGCTVEIRFGDDASFSPNDLVYVTLADGAPALRDYRARPVHLPLSPLRVYVDPGVRDVGPIGLEDDPEAPLGFEWRNGRIVPRCRVEAGTGRLGWFRPTRSMTLQHGVPFDRGDGVRVSADTRFDFTGIDIPEGVEIRIVGPIRLLACREISIRGRLSIDGPLSQMPWRPGESPSPDKLLQISVASLIAGGDISVTGVVEHENRSGDGFPVTFLSGGDVHVKGRVPPQSVFGLAAERRLLGTIESPLQFSVSMTPGLPPGVVLRAAAWTHWIALGNPRAKAVGVQLRDVRGALTAAVQIAPPHPVDEGLPLDDPLVLKQRSLKQPGATPTRLEVPARGFVRFRLQAQVRDDDLPSVGGFVIREH